MRQGICAGILSSENAVDQAGCHDHKQLDTTNLPKLSNPQYKDSIDDYHQTHHAIGL